MKIALTATGPSRDSELDPHFGRARLFVLFDTETGDLAAHDNRQNLQAAQGAGIQAAETVVRLGADAVITGNVGPKAFKALKAADVRIFLAPAQRTLGETIEAWKQNALEEASGATQEEHWI